MKMKKLLTSALLISLLVVSCKKEETQPEITTDATTESKLIIPVRPTETTTSGQAVQTQESNMMMKSSGALNPAHGQPGHRCEIAVGAPLNSAPQGVNVPKPTPTNNVQATMPKSGAANPPAVQNVNVNQVAVTPPGMNPPHGQPGHTCSVAVGAPLPNTN